MCLVFELFLCRGQHSKTDRVVGWGTFPICAPGSSTSSEAALISGQFKVPLLRGEVDSRICKFEQLERTYSDDLDQWLCNCYFDVQQLPRYADGEKEFAVELRDTSRRLQLSQRADEGGVESGDDDDPDSVNRSKPQRGRPSIAVETQPLLEHNSDEDRDRFDAELESDDEPLPPSVRLFFLSKS
jgi:hypothetical protein